MAVELATAYISLVPSMKGAQGQIAKELGGPEVQKAADQAGRTAGSKLSSGFKATAAGLLAGVSIAGIAQFTSGAVAKFSELEDSTAAAGVVFGQNMGSIISQSKTASKELGLSQQQVINAANTFGTYGKAAGLSGQELANFATQQTALAADMASFKGTSPEQAIEAIGAALRGEMEPIRQYGVLLDDATLRNEALSMGLISTTKDALTPQQKTLAAQSAILKQTTDAQGDFARTSESTANVQKTLAAEAENLQAKLGKQLAPAFTAVRNVANNVMSGFSTAIDYVVPRVQELGTWIQKNQEWLKPIAATIGGIVVAWTAYTTVTKAWTAATKAAAAIQVVLNAAMRANPVGLLVTAIGALVGALIYFFTQTETGKKIVQSAWAGIKAAMQFVADWWVNSAWPAIQRVINWFGQAFKTAGQIITIAWQGIKNAAVGAWNWINKWVINPFKLGIELLGLAFQYWRDGVTRVWNNIKSAISTAWNWINNNVFTPFKTGVSLLGTAFENVKKAIGKAWDGIKSAAAKPINFVLGTVYNNGVRKWWNTIAGAVNLDSLKLPEAKLVKFATGGVMPGYTPGRDVHKFYSPTAGWLHLSGGEAIMRPEFTRAVGGAAGVARLNAAARSGQAFASGGVFGRSPETGGFWDNVGGVASSIGRGLRSFGQSLWDAGAMAVEIIKDPIGAIKRAVSQIMNDAGSGGNGGGLFDMVGTLPAKFAVGLADKVKSMLGAQSTDGGGAGGTAAGALGVSRMSSIVRALVPGARVTSGFRQGAITATGFPSMHGMGRAIDIAAARPGDGAGMMAIFNAIRAAYPNSTELIYSPANARQLYKGRSYMFPEPTRGDHFDHVHWGMRNGGVVPSLFDNGGWLPHGGVGVNLTGRPEAVLTPEESAGLKNMLSQPRGDIHFHTVRPTPRDVVHAIRVNDLNSYMPGG